MASLKDKLKKTAQQTTQAVQSATQTAKKAAETAGVKSSGAKNTGTNRNNRTSTTTNSRLSTQTKARGAASQGQKKKTSSTTAVKNQVEQAKRNNKQVSRIENAAQQYLTRDRVARDVLARQKVRSENYVSGGRRNNKTWNQMVSDAELNRKLSGQEKEKPTTKEFVESTRLDPLDSLKADSKSYANFGRNVGVKSKSDKDTRARRREAEKQRGEQARSQTLSRFDNKLSKADQNEIRFAKADYDAAKAKGDTEKMEAAHKRAETARRHGGYSGGAAGNEHITQKISREDKSKLNKDGLAALASAKTGYANATTDKERDYFRRQGEKIRSNPAYQKEAFDRGAYRGEDANGRMRYEGTREEREKEKEQAAAIPKTIGYDIAGSFASIPEVTKRALQTDASRNQAFLNRVSEARGGGDVSIPLPETPEEETTAQRLMRKGQENREKATEGQKGLERYLTEALITTGEMAPGIAATALTGGAAAPGLAVMGAQAAGQKMGDLNARGVDPVEAFNRGLVSGGIEAGSELIPLRNLVKIGKGGGKSFAKNLLTQALEEVGTEEASEVGGYLADKTFRDPNASLTAQDLVDTAAISALTSLGMGAGAGAIGNRVQQRKTNTALDQITPTAEDIERQNQGLEERTEVWKDQADRALERLRYESKDTVYHKHLLNELAALEVEGQKLKEEAISLEMQRQQRARVEQEKAAQAAQAEREAQAAQEARQRQAAQEQAQQQSKAQSAPQTPQNAPQAQEPPGTGTLPEQQRTPIQSRETAQTATQDTTPKERKVSRGFNTPENHIDNRASENLGDRKIKAFQWDHPEIKPYYAQAAEALKRDVEDSFAMTRNEYGKGTVAPKNDILRWLADQGLNRNEIAKACDAIIHDEGQENYAAAKRVEMALDQMLSKGYQTVESMGNPDGHVGPNEEYIRAKEAISGAVTRGSFEGYVRDHQLLLDSGEVTLDKLRAEREEQRAAPQQETPQPEPEETASQREEPQTFQSKEEETAALEAQMEDLRRRRAIAANGTEEEQRQWNRDYEAWVNDVNAARERWNGQDSTTAQEEESADEQERYSVGAAPSGFDEYSHMLNEFGAIEPGENPARMVDVPQSTNGEDRVRRFARTAMEAGITPDEAIGAFEEEVAKGTFSYNPRKDKASVEAATQTLEDKGYWGAMEQWNDVVEGRRTASKDDIVLAQFLYAEAARTKDIQTMRRLAAEIAAEGTVSGQKVQALRLLKKAMPEGKLYYIHKITNKIQAELEQGRGENAPKLEIDSALEEKLLDAGTEETQNDVLDEIYDYVAKQIPPTLEDRLNAWRYFAMLGNPRTHIRNVFGNLLIQAPLQASNKISALVQAALPKEQRTRALIASKESKQFARQDYQEMKRVLSNGGKYASDEQEIKRRQKLFPEPLQKAMDFNSWALEAEDMMFKRGTYINSLAGFITARGWDPENLHPAQLEQARSHAIKDALHATFQDASSLATALSNLEKKNKATKIIFGGLVPFKGVPVNIAKMGFELSPAGLIKAISLDAANVKKGEKNGGISATDMIDHLTRGLTGTGIAMLGYFLTSSGLLTAGNGDDDKENYFNMAQGSQEYALNLGGYTYTIDWAAPSAIPLFLGAEHFNARQKWGESDEEDEGKKFKDGLQSLSRLFDPMLNMTVLSGISDTLNTVSYNQTNPIFPLSWGVLQNYAGQVVPTLLGQVARTVDDTRRTTYVDRNSPVPNSVQRFLQRQENKVPFISKKQPAYLDTWGREDKTENAGMRIFENFFSPGYISQKTTDQVDTELARLNSLGFDGVLPSKAGTNTKINDKYLSAEDYTKLVQTQGGTARDMLSEVITSQAYQEFTDAEKAAYVKKIFDFSKQVGKLAVGLPEEKADSFVLKAKEGQDTLGLDPAKYLAMAAMKSAIDKDETEADKTTKAIDFNLAVDARTDMTEEQKAFVKDNIKFWNMIPVSTAGFDKGIAAGMTAEEAKEMLALKKSADTDGNGSLSTQEIYASIESTGKSEAEKEQLWEAMRPSNSSKTYSQLSKEQEANAAERKKWAALVPDISQEQIDAFNHAVNNRGGYNSLSYGKFFDTMDDLGIPESQWGGYYAVVQSMKGKPFTRDLAGARAYAKR